MYESMKSGECPNFLSPNSKIFDVTFVSFTQNNRLKKLNKQEIGTNFAAVVLHQSGCRIDFVSTTSVFTRSLEYSSGGCDALSSSPKLHVLNVDQSRIETRRLDL